MSKDQLAVANALGEAIGRKGVRVRCAYDRRTDSFVALPDITCTLTGEFVRRTCLGQNAKHLDEVAITAAHGLAKAIITVARDLQRNFGIKDEDIPDEAKKIIREG